MRHFSGTLLLSVLLMTCAAAHAQHHEAEKKPTTGPVDLGEINFPTSGPADAQKHFIQGVLLLHSFEYDRARKSFLEASRIAPTFAMAIWGEAMTYEHPIWGEEDRPAALAALARLGATAEERRAKTPTEREKLYLDAVERLYGEGGKPQRAAAYSQAMGELSKRFPDDLDASAFYSLSLLGLTGTVRDTENYMRAAAVAESIYEKNPRHPGALHYLIHAYDDPVHAPLGLRAARLYGTVARGASHAQHMPSHIFFALGMWDDAIAANTASMKTARDGGAGGYHPLHWLEHAYLQVGRIEEAAKLVSIVEEDLKLRPSPAARTHLAMTRATFLVDAPGAGPASMMEPVDPAWVRSFGVFAGHDLAIGLEYVRRKDLTSARTALDDLRRRNAAGKAPATGESEVTDRYSSASPSDIDASGVMERILDAAIKFASGQRDEALQLIRVAGQAEDKLIFEYGPPATVKPAWEEAGEMFMDAGRKREAYDAFQRVLKRYPNRKISVEGQKAALR